jgi:hypothetical protein
MQETADAAACIYGDVSHHCLTTGQFNRIKIQQSVKHKMGCTTTGTASHFMLFLRSGNITNIILQEDKKVCRQQQKK